MHEATHRILDRHAALPAFALRRPVTILMLLLSALVLGTVSYMRLPMALAPESLTAPVLFIRMPYPSADPAEVEQKIARPVEEILGSVKGVRRLDSTSNAGGASILLWLKEDVSVDTVYPEVKDRIERIERELPDDLEHYYIFRWRATDWPVLVLGFSADVSDPAAMYRLIEDKIKVRLQRIDGVANVDAFGLRQDRVLVALRQERLEAHGADISAVYSMLARDNFTLAGGLVQDGGGQHYVRTLAKYRSLEEIRSLRVPGTNVPLSAVADVEAKLPEIQRVTQVDGRPAVLLQIKKESEANTVEVSRRVHAALAELGRDPELQRLEHFLFFDQGEAIASSLSNLLSSGFWGGAFAVLVLLGFLRRMRPTLVIALSIPLSLLVTTVILYFLGMSLNIGSMLGLMIGIGMLVDNSIVVVENIFRLRDEGLPPRQAALRGASEVGVAITASTATTAVVFLPLIFMSGPLGTWMREIGLPVSISVVVSLLVALTLIPLATAYMPARGRHKKDGHFGRAHLVYGRLLERTLARRAETFLALLLVIGGTVLLAQNSLTFSGSPASDRRRVNMHLHYDTPRTLEQSRSLFLRLASMFEQRRDELEIDHVYLSFDHVHGDIELFLTPQRKLKNTEQITDEVRAMMPTVPGTHVSINNERDDDEGVQILLQGKDSALLETFAAEALRRLRGVEGIRELSTSMDERRDELHMRIDRARSWRQGLSSQELAASLSLGVRGRKAGTLNKDGAELDIVLQLGEQNRQSLEALQNLPVPVRTAAGGAAAGPGGAGGGPGSADEPRQPGAESVPLSTMAGFQVARALGERHRRDGMATLEIKATTNEKDLAALRGRIQKALEGFELPRGYAWTLGGRFERIGQDQGQSSLSAALAAILVFLIMGMLFESFVHPITVMLTLPFAWLGFVWMMAATQTPVDLLGSVGLVVLIGVVVNNSIVVVDRINQLRRLGWQREQAIVQAGMDRMRPVLMTAATTVLGLVPMALDSTAFQYQFNELLKSVGLAALQLGSGNSSLMMYNSLGRAIMGGLIAGTLSTLLLTPYFYALFDDLRLWIGRVAATLWPARGAGA
jgi:hydrophobic/amphiphilic exporter-1 (mainly G- bacteria), HAE1 family